MVAAEPVMYLVTLRRDGSGRLARFLICSIVTRLETTRAQSETDSFLRRHRLRRLADPTGPCDHPGHTRLGYWTVKWGKCTAPGFGPNRRGGSRAGPGGHLSDGIHHSRRKLGDRPQPHSAAIDPRARSRRGGAGF